VSIGSGGSRICQGADHGEREPKRGSGAGSRGRATGGGQTEVESFLSIFMQKSGQNLRI